MTFELIPTDLTDEQKSHIPGILSIGCDRQTAADRVGCSLADIRRTMQQDAKFAAEVCRAEAGAELSHMSIVKEIATEKKEWRAAVWWLEQRSPERFGRRRPGAVTARQLKEFIGIVAAVLQEDAASGGDRQPILARLNSLAESVQQMLRDGQLNGSSSTDASDPVEADALSDDSCDSDVEDWSDLDVED